MFFLSGGIEPEDIEKLHAFGKSETAKKLFSVDINSRFEISNGIKNLERIESFAKALKNS